MRNPERIERICKRLERLWKKYPDMRMGQILENFVFGHHLEKGNCIFYQEDDITERNLDKVLEE
jgi:hypothetical protein